MKTNPENNHLFTTHEEKDITVMENEIKNKASEKLFDISIDTNFSFREHVHEICKKASQKLNTLATISFFIEEEEEEEL